MSRKLLIETHYFSIYEDNGKLDSDHSDGRGFCGEDTEDTWIEVRDTLNNHYKLTVFTEKEMDVLKILIARGDEPNTQTMKHHIEDMEACCVSLRKKLGL